MTIIWNLSLTDCFCFPFFKSIWIIASVKSINVIFFLDFFTTSEYYLTYGVIAFCLSLVRLIFLVLVPKETAQIIFPNSLLIWHWSDKPTDLPQTISDSAYSINSLLKNKITLMSFQTCGHISFTEQCNVTVLLNF